MKIAIGVCYICITLIGCTQKPKVNIASEANAIRNIENQWTVAIKEKDNDKTLGFFAPHAVVMNPNLPASVGVQAIRESQESWFSDTTILHNTFESKIDTIEISASLDLAYVRGIYRIKTGSRNNPVEDVGKWVTIYRKLDGKWKAIVDISNSDSAFLFKTY